MISKAKETPTPAPVSLTPAAEAAASASTGDSTKVEPAGSTPTVPAAPTSGAATNIEGESAPTETSESTFALVRGKQLYKISWRWVMNDLKLKQH